MSNVSVDGKTTMTSQRQRRPTRISLPEKKANDDEFMAAAIGDVEWLKHTFKGKKATRMNYDKNVRVKTCLLFLPFSLTRFNKIDT